MSETRIETTIDGVQVRARKSDGWIFWTSAWERIWELNRADLIRVEHYGPGTYGHSSFFLLNEGRT